MQNTHFCIESVLSIVCHNKNVEQLRLCEIVTLGISKKWKSTVDIFRNDLGKKTGFKIAFSYWKLIRSYSLIKVSSCNSNFNIKTSLVLKFQMHIIIYS